MSHFSTFIVLLSLVTSIPTLAEDCIRHQSQLDNHPAIKSTIDKMGGMEDLQGVWDLNILFAQKRIIFQNRPEGMKASVNGSEFASILICDQANSDALEIRILEKDGKTTTQNVLVKPGKAGSMQVAAQESQWKYYNFAKTGGTTVARMPTSTMSGKK